MENSIEEDIKRLKEMIEKANIENMDMNDCFGGEHIEALEHILSDYKRALKENERYQKSDYETICLENNELREITDRIQSEYNDLLKDNFKLKDELETKRKEYQETYKDVREELKELRKENEELKNEVMEKDLEIIGKEEYTKASMKEIIEQYYTAKEECIPKQRIKDIIDRIDYDIKKTKEIISKNTNIYATYRKNDYQIVRLRAMNTKSLDIKKRLQKLLESEE